MENNSESYIVVKEFIDKGKTTREVIAKGVTKQGFIDAYTEKGCVMRGGENPHFEDIYSGVVYKLENHFEEGGQVDRERDIEIAKTILMQLGGSNRLQMFTGAYNFVAVPNGVSFRIKNQSVNYVKIVLNAMDTYDIEFGRISGVNYKIVKELSGIYNDQLVEVFTQYTGMVLRFSEGGAIQGEENAEMVMNQNFQIRHHTEELEEILKSGKEVPAWVVSKVSRAADSMSDATHYLEGTLDKMERGGNPRMVDISKLKVYVLTYVPVFDINRAMQIKQKAVYAESEEDAISQLPRKAKVLSIQVSGGGRGTPQQQRVRQSPLSQQIQNEIKALKEMLPFLEGKDKKQVQDAIENLEDTLDEMRAEGQYADGGEVYDSADGISPAIQKAFNSLQSEGYFEKEAIEYVGGIKEWNKLSTTEKEIIISDIEKDWSKSTFFAEGGEVDKMAKGGNTRIVKAQNGRKSSLSQQIRNEIKALKEMLPLLEGKDKKQVQDEIQNLKDKLDEMRGEGQYADGEYFVSTNKYASGGGVGKEEIQFIVRYEKLWDGEYDNFTKVFKDKEQALDFAKEVYSSVDYEKLDTQGKTIDVGFVNVNNGELVSYKNKKYAQGGGVGKEILDAEFWKDIAHLWRTRHIDIDKNGNWYNTEKYRGVNNTSGLYFTNESANLIVGLANSYNVTLLDIKNNNPNYTAFNYDKKRLEEFRNKEYANGGGVDNNTFVNILLDYGFVEKRSSYGIRHFYNKSKDFYASLDEKQRVLDIYKDDDMVVQGRDYNGYSIQSVIDFLNKNGFESGHKYFKGGGVGNFPPKGELKNKENLLLKYEKIGSDYEFFVYKPEKRDVSSYEQIKYVCVNKDCPTRMSYNQFLNYLYAETYLDDRKYAKGGEVFVCPVGTQIQTLIFDKSMFNLRQAKAWAKKNNFKNDFVDGKLNTFRIRQKDPAMFTEDGFRTIQLRQGVQAVIGCPKKRTIRRKK